MSGLYSGQDAGLRASRNSQKSSVYSHPQMPVTAPHASRKSRYTVLLIILTRVGQCNHDVENLEKTAIDRREFGIL